MRTDPWAFDRACWWMSARLGGRWVLGRRVIWRDPLPFRDYPGYLRQRDMGWLKLSVRPPR